MGRWYPPFQYRTKFSHFFLAVRLRRTRTFRHSRLTRLPEDAQLVDVAGNGMVLVVTGYDLVKPSTDVTGAIVLSAL